MRCTPSCRQRGFEWPVFFGGRVIASVLRQMVKTDLLPFRTERRFSLHLYWVSHGLLLLRSGKEDDISTRIDIAFHDVRWMNLPTWFDGLQIERASAILGLSPKLLTDLDGLCQFDVVTSGTKHQLIASESVAMMEDDEDYFGNSKLLPDLDLRALQIDH